MDFQFLRKLSEEDWLDFSNELSDAIHSRDCGAVEAVFHEWKESIAVAESGILDSALAEANEEEEIPLTRPDSLNDPA